MFGLFKKRPPSDPPTDKQRKYAACLGVDVTADMSRSDVSAAISQAERRNPKAAAQRERVKAESRRRKFGQEVLDQESHWNHFADDPEFMLAVYSRGKKKIVDVLRVNEAFISATGKLRLGVAAPKVVKDRYIGQHLDWDRNFELPIDCLLYHEPLRTDFYEHDADSFALGNRRYREFVEKGLKIARKL